MQIFIHEISDTHIGNLLKIKFVLAVTVFLQGKIYKIISMSANIISWGGVFEYFDYE